MYIEQLNGGNGLKRFFMVLYGAQKLSPEIVEATSSWIHLLCSRKKMTSNSFSN